MMLTFIAVIRWEWWRLSVFLGFTELIIVEKPETGYNLNGDKNDLCALWGRNVPIGTKTKRY